MADEVFCRSSDLKVTVSGWNIDTTWPTAGCWSYWPCVRIHWVVIHVFKVFDALKLITLLPS